jgi:DNA polymerase III delta prime subunit
MSNEFLWVEKYRPQTVSECILPKSIKSTFSSILKSGEIPNMLFTGTAGVGKTTIARALCNELGLDYIIINGSEEGNIDTLRGKIKHFASTISLSGSGYKVVILDEADYLNANSFQPALRGFIEEYSKNCRFILTCNFKNRIIEPLHSRCSTHEFNIPNSEKPKLASEFFKRLTGILEKESVQFEPRALATLIERFFPDWRRVLNECQRYSISGSIDAGILVNLSDTNVDVLMTSLKDKDFKTMRKWVVDNIDTDPQIIFRKVYDTMTDFVAPASVPQMVLIIADYQYKNAFVADREINTVAFMTELMANMEWK